MTILKHKKVKAVKVHECFYCRKPIQSGEYYVVLSYFGDSGIEGYKMHPDCEGEYIGKLEALDSIIEYHEANAAL